MKATSKWLNKMSDKKKYRIDGFEQLNAFYSVVFSGEHNFTTQHISLYIFLFNQCNRSHWIEWFKCPFDLAMTGSGIGSRKTYYKVLKELNEWNLIKYEAGVNNWKAPKIHLIQIGKKGQVNVPLCEQADAPLTIQLPTHLPTPLRVRYINIITGNINNILTNNFPEFEKLNFDFKKFFTKRKKEIVPPGKIEGATDEILIHPFTSPKWLNTWEVWLKYRNQIGKPYKNDFSKQAQLKELADYNEDVAIKMIEKSIASGWQGIFPLKENNNQTNGRTGQIFDTPEKLTDALRAGREEYKKRRGMS